MLTQYTSLLLAALVSTPSPEAFGNPFPFCASTANEPRWDSGPLAFPNGEREARPPEEQVLHDDLVVGGFLLFDQATRGDGPPENAIFSPYVVQTAMSAVVAGARGRTAEQLTSALAWRLPAAEILTGMGALEARLLRQLAEEREAIVQRSRDWPPFAEPRAEDVPRLDLASRLWPEESLPLLDTFWRQVSQSGLSVDAQRLDFENNPEPSRRTINDWTAARTAGLIPELLPPGSIQEDTGLVITTALYFQARWQKAFAPLPAAGFTFYPPGRLPQPTAGMQVTAHLPILETDRFTAVDVPYGTGGFSLLIVQPKAENKGSLANITFTPEDYGDFFRLAHLTEVKLTMPTFSLRSASSLKNSFKNLGVDEAFQKKWANFHAMYDIHAEKQQRNLYIDDIYKEAFIEVTPEGTRAGAAVAVVMPLFGCARLSSPVPIQIDQPFLFVLHDRETQTPLFLGRLIEPTAEP